MIDLVTLSGTALSPGSLSKRFQYADDSERQYVVKMAKLASKERTRIHLLSDTLGNDYGFVALSFSSFDRSFNRSSIVIDYIFTSNQFRGQKFPAMGNVKVFENLLDFTFQSALSIQKIIPLRFIALQPAHDRLAAYYQKMDFKPVENSEWMFLSI
jgi:hypothetical protein